MINILFILSFSSSLFLTFCAIIIPYNPLIIINITTLFTVIWLFISLRTNVYLYLLVIWFNTNQIIVFMTGSSIVSVSFNLITIVAVALHYFYSK